MRALVTAFLASVLVVLISNYHDGIVVRYEVSLHDYIAPLVLGLMFLVVLVLNGLVRVVRRSWGLSAGELAVALTLMMVVSPVPRYFANHIVGTVGYTPALIDAKDPTVAALSRTNIYQALPPQAFLSLNESHTFDRGLSQNLGQMAPLWHSWDSWYNPPKPQSSASGPAEHLSSAPAPAVAAPTTRPPGSPVPWQVWIKPLLYWAPLLLAFLCLSVSFGLFLYRQWALRELVPFPLAEFSVSLIRNEQGRAFPDVFYSAGFWVGFGIMVFVFGCNGLHGYVERMIEIPVRFQYYELSQTFPFLRDAHEGYSLLRGFMFFTTIAVAVLLPVEISFTSWATWPVMVFCTYFFYLQTGRKLTGNELGSIQNGAWWAMAVVILYTGRTYYLAVLRKALAIPFQGAAVARQEVWVFRLFLASAIGFTVLLNSYGLPWDLAIIWTICLVITLLVSCRLVAEMGISWMPIREYLPLNVLMMTMGGQVLGRRAYALFSILTTVTTPTRTSSVLFTPAVANAVHIESRITGRNDSWKAIGPFLLVILVLSLAVGIWFGYSNEGQANDYHTRLGILEVTGAAQTLRGELATAGTAAISNDDMRKHLAENNSIGQRWGAFAMPWSIMPYLGFGVALVAVTAFMRLKFPRFPLHPLPFVLAGTWLMSRLWFSFLVGWLIKKAILKIGGGRLFERCRPFFTGVVVGQAVVFVVFVIVNIIVYWNSNYTFESKWWMFFKDMYSS